MTLAARDLLAEAILSLDASRYNEQLYWPNFGSLASALDAKIGALPTLRTNGTRVDGESPTTYADRCLYFLASTSPSLTLQPNGNKTFIGFAPSVEPYVQHFHIEFEAVFANCRPIGTMSLVRKWGEYNSDKEWKFELGFNGYPLISVRNLTDDLVAVGPTQIPNVTNQPMTLRVDVFEGGGAHFSAKLADGTYYELGAAGFSGGVKPFIRTETASPIIVGRPHAPSGSNLYFDGKIYRVHGWNSNGTGEFGFDATTAAILAATITDLYGNGAWVLQQNLSADTNKPTFLPGRSRKYLWMPGTPGNRVYLNDTSVGNIGQAENAPALIAVEVEPTTWRPSADMTLISKGGANDGWRLMLTTSGFLRFVMLQGGISRTFVSTMVVPDDLLSRYLACWIYYNGATWTCEFYYDRTLESLGTATATFNGVTSTAGVLELGSHDSGTANRFAGKILAASVDYAQSTIVDIQIGDFDDEMPDQIFDRSGRVWTVTRVGDAAKRLEVVDRDGFLFGADDYVSVAPHSSLQRSGSQPFTVFLAGRFYGDPVASVQTLATNRDDNGVGFLLQRSIASTLTLSPFSGLTVTGGRSIRAGEVTTFGVAQTAGMAYTILHNEQIDTAALTQGTGGLSDWIVSRGPIRMRFFNAEPNVTTTIPPGETTKGVVIGTSQNLSSDPAGFVLYGFAYWNRALSADELRAVSDYFSEDPSSRLPKVSAKAIIDSGISRLARRVDILEADGVTPWRENVGFVSGSVSVDGSRSERRSLTIALDNTDGSLNESPNGGFWYDKIIRVQRGVVVPNVGEVMFPLGYFMIDRISADGRPDIVNVTGRDFTKKLLKWKPTTTLVYLSGTKVETVVDDLLKRAGVSSTFRQRLGYTGYSLSADLTIEPSDTSIFDTLNDLVAANTMEIFFDADGQARVQPRTDPAKSARSAVFVTGDGGNVHKIQKSSNDSYLYNVVFAHGKTSAGLIVYAQAVNSEPTSPTNINRIGPRVYRVPDNPLIDSTPKAQAVANAYLAVQALEQYEATVDADVIPWLEANTTVEFVNPYKTTEEPTRYLLSSFEVPLAADAMSLSLRRITLIGNTLGVTV